MGIIDKVKNSKIAKTAIGKANEYVNSDKKENRKKESNSDSGKEQAMNKAKDK